jgi:hypothetical protein
MGPPTGIVAGRGRRPGDRAGDPGLDFERPQLTRREPTMLDLAVITAIVARDRVADQFAGPAVTAAAPRGPVRRAAVRALRAVADRREPAPRYAAQT